MKHAIVAGGAGFLGSHMCDALVGRGASVLCIDDLSTGAMRNIAHLLDREQFRFLRHDVTLPLPHYVEGDQIYNFACPASPAQYRRNPVQTAKTAFLGTMHLLDVARRTGARLFQASTSEVYGDPEVHPQPEEYFGHVNPVGPRACYVESKRSAESLCLDYNRQFGVAVRIARIFNTYGPRMDPHDGRVISNFIVQALTDRHLTIFGKGIQTRSFCYVDDLVRGVLALMGSAVKIAGPVNLGNPQECSIRQLAEHVARLTGIELKLSFAPSIPDDPSRRLPDISRAKTLLSWEPRVTFDEGLLKTIAYLEPLLEHGRSSLPRGPRVASAGGEAATLRRTRTVIHGIPA